MSRERGTVIAGAVALALLLASPLSAGPGPRRSAGDGWLAMLWSWVGIWAEDGPMIDPDGRPTTDDGPMSDPDGRPTTDEGPMIDPDGARIDATGRPMTDEGPMIDPNG